MPSKTTGNKNTGYVYEPSHMLTAVILKPNSTIYVHNSDGKLICKVNSREITARDDISFDRNSDYGYCNCFKEGVKK